jgi:RNA polymerase sigma-70 factor, ECF subfamily
VDRSVTVHDAGLIARAVAGDAQALRQLVERYEPRVYRFAMRVCRNEEDAREILQNTFLNAIRALSTFRGESQFATWLFRIVVNNCAKVHGTRAAAAAREITLDAGGANGEVAPFSREPVDWSQDPEAGTLTAEARERLEAAIDGLAPGYKGVFLLRDLEGFSTAETAHILNISGEAAKTRLHRARLFLRDQLAGYFIEH